MTATKTVTANDAALLLAGLWAEVDQDILVKVADAMAGQGDALAQEMIELLPVTVSLQGDEVEDEVTCRYGANYEDIARDLMTDSDSDKGKGDYCITILWSATNYAGELLADGSFELLGVAEAA